MTIILMGPPGAGKGTHGSELSKMFKIPHVSTGDLFRNSERMKEVVGQYVNAGLLVPDEVADPFIHGELKQRFPEGYILDGYPRTAKQAEELLRWIAGHEDVLLIELVVEPAILRERLEGRRVCSTCRSVTNTAIPGYSDGCACGGTFKKRPDDDMTIAQARLLQYEVDTIPAISVLVKAGIHHIKVHPGDVLGQISTAFGHSLSRG